ncbi:MAG TPA: TMEM175 family protein [Burkholderiaceae bacterium]|nr:TMEM175 family protein [Burkholderiaceae bacterium]
MDKGRLEAFSDGVIAVIITIMVLELKVPHADGIAALQGLVPTFLSYVLSFVFVAIYWHNHHHMLHAVQHVDGRVLWANSHLLFWLSLVPFTTAWMAEYPLAPWPTVTYGVVLFLSAVAYTLLQVALLKRHGRESALARAVGSDAKGRASLALYATAIACACVVPWVAMGIYVLVALIWLVPDRRIERVIGA